MVSRYLSYFDKTKLLFVTVTVTVLKQKKFKDCRRRGGVDRWRRKGELEMEDEGEGRRLEGEIEGRDERWEGGFS
jgi:hypothetical protein